MLKTPLYLLFINLIISVNKQFFWQVINNYASTIILSKYLGIDYCLISRFILRNNYLIISGLYFMFLSNQKHFILFLKFVNAWIKSL